MAAKNVSWNEKKISAKSSKTDSMVFLLGMRLSTVAFSQPIKQFSFFTAAFFQLNVGRGTLREGR